MALDEWIGKEIVRMRKELNYSYQEIADELRSMGIADLSTDTVRRYLKDYIGTQPNIELPSAPADLDKSVKPDPSPNGNVDIEHRLKEIADALRTNYEEREKRRESDGENVRELKTNTRTWLILILSIASLVLVVLVVIGWLR
jgi:transcriptional regulator with XRE-family HTH domain